ncbi:hypothetical protein M011DRAFT_484514 [Sporormia fimetaria CBS 119925]|uniref:DUF6604 domain-containing protein n=1 Tax=Sporormia fimetaria CBS 119925 TaxID=1340428 RepID=A0A6A6VGW8_9PLEO|nr:hypothetical protein M011DRAFT_484514 [Sporormia fimetaria CBS 119925]
MDFYRLRELPETYQKCKAYTQKFQKWLLEEAEQRHIEVSEFHTKAEKSRRKNGKGGKYRIPVAQLIPLAESIAAKGPLNETSGLDYLRDAIRARKEVTSYYTLIDQSDTGHSFMIEALQKCRQILKSVGGWNVVNIMFKGTQEEHDLPNQETNEADHQDWDEDQEVFSLAPERTMPDTAATGQNRSLKKTATKSNKPVHTGWTEEEMALEQNFQVLCFLYDYYQIRGSVQQAWEAYQLGSLSLANASILTDLAMAIIKKNTEKLSRGLQDGDSGRSLRDILKHVSALVAERRPDLATPMDDDRVHEPYPIFCTFPFVQLAEVQRRRQERVLAKDVPYGEAYWTLPFIVFVRHLRSLDAYPPLPDNFTRSVISQTKPAGSWLPFGLDILLLVQQQMDDNMINQFLETTADGIMRIQECMKGHMEYEDKMWAAGTKPDYMTVGETKFSNVFLSPCDQMVRWMDSVFGEPEEDDPKKMTALDFIANHPVMAGLTLYHFQNKYQMLTISKTQWFIIALCHLYNACRQIGGLSAPWPDLEYIIETHGTRRIFIGARPTDPQKFAERLNMGLLCSARGFSEDQRIRTKWNTLPRTDKKTRGKRGLKLHSVLTELVNGYYYGHTNENRWIRLHNLFAHIYQKEKAGKPIFASKVSAETRKLFEAFVQTLEPKKGKGKKAKKDSKQARVKTPKFSAESYIYSDLLSKLQSALKEEELHFNFDYLSFYRRSFAFVQNIRADVLFPTGAELQRLTPREKEPDNYNLLVELFRSLKIAPKDTSAKIQGDGLSKDVVALDQLRKISRIMEKLILEEGDAELSKAQQTMQEAAPRQDDDDLVGDMHKGDESIDSTTEHIMESAKGPSPVDLEGSPANNQGPGEKDEEKVDKTAEDINVTLFQTLADIKTNHSTSGSDTARATGSQLLLDALSDLSARHNPQRAHRAMAEFMERLRRAPSCLEERARLEADLRRYTDWEQPQELQAKEQEGSSVRKEEVQELGSKAARCHHKEAGLAERTRQVSPEVAEQKKLERTAKEKLDLVQAEIRRLEALDRPRRGSLAPPIQDRKAESRYNPSQVLPSEVKAALAKALSAGTEKQDKEKTPQTPPDNSQTPVNEAESLVQVQPEHVATSNKRPERGAIPKSSLFFFFFFVVGIGMLPRSWTMYTGLIGHKKRRVMFPCAGTCCLTRATRIPHRCRRRKADRELKWEVEGSSEGSSWEMDSDGSERDWFDAVEYQSVDVVA